MVSKDRMYSDSRAPPQVQLSDEDISMMISAAEEQRAAMGNGGRRGEGVDMRTYLSILTNCPWY
jgi:hypothetical protein